MIKKFKAEASIPLIFNCKDDDMMDEIIRRKKIELFSKAEEIIGEKPFSGKFTITGPTDRMVQKLADSVKSVNDMYALYEDINSREDAEAKIRETRKIIELEIFVDE